MRLIMQPTNDNPNSSTNDPEWRFLGEFPLNELMIEMDNRDRTSVLFQIIRDIGIHPDHLSNIESKLVGFVKEGVSHLNSHYHAPVFIRLFCQTMMMEEINSAKLSRQLTAEQTSEPSHLIHHSGAGINGGWGCFLIKRGGKESENASSRALYFVDLYLYREG